MVKGKLARLDTYSSQSYFRPAERLVLHFAPERRSPSALITFPPLAPPCLLQPDIKVNIFCGLTFEVTITFTLSKATWPLPGCEGWVREGGVHTADLTVI